MELESGEDGDNQAKTQEAAPDLRVAPWVDTSAPLQGEKEADDGTDEEKGTKEVDLSNLLASGEFAMLAFRVLEKEENSGNRADSEREIDPMRRVN
jgi:hypothetical protein